MGVVLFNSNFTHCQVFKKKHISIDGSESCNKLRSYKLVHVHVQLELYDYVVCLTTPWLLCKPQNIHE